MSIISNITHRLAESRAVLASWIVLVACAIGAPAAAATPTTQTFTTAGTYYVTVPDDAARVLVDATGASGSQAFSLGDVAVGQAAPGSGTNVSETIPVAAGDQIQPGRLLKVVVGAQGGGGRGGFSSGFGFDGGNGGGATYLLTNADEHEVVAGGGGGAGGDAFAAPGFAGGSGGTNGAGQATFGPFGNIAARGGAAGGFNCPTSGPALRQGDPGEDVTNQANSGGGGGGGGQGYCGGQGGGSGDHGAGAATGLGGGGGGAGGSEYSSQATSGVITSSTGTGDGSMILTFLSGPTASVSSNTIDFGDQLVGTTSQPKYVTITNNGDLPLSINLLSLSGGDVGDFTGDLSTCTSGTVAPGSSCQFGARFAPTGRGSRSTTLELSDNAGDSPQKITLTGTGQVPATATLSATSIAFGGQQVGTTSQPKYVTITNSGDRPLSISGLDERINEQEQFIGTFGTCTRPLAAGESCQLGATFAPKSAGDHSALLLVTDNAADSPQQITLSGTGLAPATATLSATSIAFGGQQVGTSQTKYVTVTNNGGVPLTLLGLNLGTNNPKADFIGAIGTCGSAVAPGSSCQLGATFAPRSTGDHSAVLFVYDSAADSPQQISLTGTGLAPATATLSATSIAFGNQQVGTISQPKYVTLTNNGGVPLTISALNDGIPQNQEEFLDTFGTCGPTLAPGSSCQLGARFAPRTTGNHSVTVSMSDSAGDSPQQITLTGTGVAPGATATLGATSIAFGEQQVSSASAPKDITLTNSGDAPLTFDRVSAAGADSNDFVVDAGTCSGTIAAGSSCKLTASFKPTVSGDRSGTLQVYDGAADSPQTVTLTGTGTVRTTTTSVTASASPTAGAPVSLTATVTPIPDGGTVAFTDDGTPVSACASQAVDQSTGTATCTLIDTKAGSHTIIARYVGDATFGGSTGTTTITVSAGRLAKLILSPAKASVAARRIQTYRAEGYDTYGNDLGSVTPATRFTIAPASGHGQGHGTPAASCTRNACSAIRYGTYTVTGTDRAATGAATLIVVAGGHLSSSGAHRIKRSSCATSNVQSPCAQSKPSHRLHRRTQRGH